MNFKLLFADDDAVSPVIGVILMVAITVILAAVIGTFVLGLGDQVQQTSPTTQLSTDQTTETLTVEDGGGSATDISNKTMTISHDGGDGLEGENIDVTVNGEKAWGYDSSGTYYTPTELWTSGSISAGSEITIVAGIDVDESADSASTIVSDGQFTYDSSSPGNGLTITDDGDADGTTVTGTYQDVSLKSGDTVRVTWNSDEGRSSTLLEKDIN